jgi:hypothetical protein
MKLVTRAQWGARNYRLPSGATLYGGSRRRGVKLHYLGSAYSDRTHDKCDDYVRSLQASHMDGNGWSDIGYSFVVCTHGYVYEGRGLRRRNSANGNTTLNEQDYAVCLLVGSSGLTQPTDAQLHGARDAIDYCRSEGPAGTWVGGHRDGFATSCPGDPIYVWAKKGAPRPTTTSAPAQEDEDPMAGMTKDDIYNAVWRLDKMTPPTGTETKDNPTWAAESVLRDAANQARALRATVTAQGAAIEKLAGLVGQDSGSTAEVVSAVQKAIRDAVIQVDVDITGTTT